MTRGITSINNIISSIDSLYGAEVRVFGQAVKLDTKPSNDDLIIDTVDVLEALKPYAFDYMEYVNSYHESLEIEFGFDEFEEIDSRDFDEVLDLLYNMGFLTSELYEKGDNTYNWCSPITHHINYEIYKTNDGGVLVGLSVHRFGDIRGNYTDSCLLYFDSIDAFYTAIYENTDKYMAVEVDGITYDFNLSVFSDCFEVWSVDGDYICTAYGDTLEEVADTIRDKIA